MIYVFFPFFNEGQSVIRLIERVHEASPAFGAPYQILAVDDGSSDNAANEIQKQQEAALPLTLIRHEHNRGLADALQTGIDWLRTEGKPDDIVIMMDGDDTHDPHQIPEMLSRLDNGADIVIASRYREGASIAGLSNHRTGLSAGASYVGRLFFGLPGVRDYSCGYRAIRLRLLTEVCDRWSDELFELKRYGFTCSVELLLKLSKLEPRIEEIPLALHYERKASPSKMRTLRTMIGYAHLIVRHHRFQPKSFSHER